MDSKIDSLRTKRAQATIDDLNQYLQDNIGADDLVDSLQDMIKFLKQFIFENKTDNFDLKKYLAEGRLLKEGEYTYMNDANTEFGPDVLDLDYDKIRHYIANIKGDDFANNFIDGYNDDFYENVVRFFDKIENPTDEEVINFIDAEIEK